MTLRWALTDAWTIAVRDMSHWVRRPGLVLMGLTFPVLLFAMFAYLFGAGMSVPGGGDYLDFLVPGMFAVTVFFGLEATMMAVNADAERGVTDRFRSMPIASPAVVAGRSVADMLFSVVSLVPLVGAGLLAGWRWNEGLASAAFAFALLLLLRFACIWVGLYLGLVLKDQESVGMVQILVWPLVGLSSAFNATQNMPDWLGTIADWSPLSSTINATRALFGNPGAGGDSWIAQHGELMAIVWPLVLLAVFFPLSVRAWRALGD